MYKLYLLQKWVNRISIYDFTVPWAIISSRGNVLYFMQQNFNWIVDSHFPSEYFVLIKNNEKIFLFQCVVQKSLLAVYTDFHSCIH